MSLARDHNYTHVRLLLCRPQHRWHKQLGQQCVAKIIDSKMVLVAFRRHTWRNADDACVEIENIQPFLLVHKIGRTFPDGLQGREIQVKIANLGRRSRSFCVRWRFSVGLMGDFQGQRRFGVVVARQVCNIDAGRPSVASQLDGRVSTKVSCGSGDEDHFARQRRNVSRGLKGGAFAAVARPEQGDASHLPELGHGEDDDDDDDEKAEDDSEEHDLTGVCGWGGWGEWQRRWVKMVRVSRVAHGGEVQQGVTES